MTEEKRPEQDKYHGASVVEAPQQDSPPAVAPAESIPEDGKFELAEEKRVERIVHQVLQAESFFGPTPHPKHVQHYEKVLPGSAKILFDEFQANGAHQRRMEERQMALQERAMTIQEQRSRDDVTRDNKNRNSAIGLTVFLLVVTFGLAYFGFEKAAIAVATVLGVAILSAFLTGRIQSSGDNGNGKKQSKGPEQSEEKESAKLSPPEA